MTELRALGFWDDNTYYPCLLKDVEDPRKNVDQYKVGEKIRTKIRGFRDYYTGEIIAISRDLKQLKTLQKELESKKTQPPQQGTKRGSTSSLHNDKPEKNREKKNPAQKQANDNGQQARVNDNAQTESQNQKRGKKTGSDQANKKQKQVAENVQKENDNSQTGGKNSTKKNDHDHVTQAEKKRLAKEETAKKKAVEAARNSSFLQSLQVFKEKVQQPVNSFNLHTYSPDSSLLEEKTPLRNQSNPGSETMNSSTMGSPGGWIPQSTSTPVCSPICTWQTPSLGDSNNRVQQNRTPVRPTAVRPRTELSWQTETGSATFTELISTAEVPGPANDSVSSHPLGTAIKEARMVLDEAHESNIYLDLSEQETGLADVSEGTSEEQTNSCQQCQTCESLKGRIQELEQELRRARLQQLNSSQSGAFNPVASQIRLQRDGKPRAGLVKADHAEKYKMVELMPGSSVYIYPATLRAVQKVETQTGKARTLLSAFYSNAELVQAGNLTGANGKPGLNEKIVSAVVDYSLLQAQTCSASEIRSALRRKITGLTSWTSNKENSF